MIYNTLFVPMFILMLIIFIIIFINDRFFMILSSHFYNQLFRLKLWTLFQLSTLMLMLFLAIMITTQKIHVFNIILTIIYLSYMFSFGRFLFERFIKKLNLLFVFFLLVRFLLLFFVLWDLICLIIVLRYFLLYFRKV